MHQRGEFLLLFVLIGKEKQEIQRCLFLLEKDWRNKKDPAKKVSRPKKNECRYLVVRKWNKDERFSVEDERVCNWTLIAEIFLSIVSFLKKHSWRRRTDVSDSSLNDQQSLFFYKEAKRYNKSFLRCWLSDLLGGSRFQSTHCDRRRLMTTGCWISSTH